MALDADTKAFLDLKDPEIAPWTAARAAARELTLSPDVLPNVIDNVALLRTQASLFVSALGELAGEPPETFQP
ncbi:hypothetical protein [Caulobacter sp. FWC2]|uniref:hypothetical protein n=1 Tax=Caulobacter sp. FWC2 TaxID=69664 RepID=UPI000C156BE5|nr:hypothetical protein [Caulobacter sp. FWC2]PIB91086.1 hypothetical protein CSW62_05595 [Caulobacter sp. FWC2]